MKQKQSFWNAHVEYLKDNPKGYWFKRKLYGWGWIPVTWNGWAVIAFFLLYIIILAKKLHVSQGASIEWFLLKLTAAIVILIIICYKKGEKPKWMWGPPKQKKKKK